MKSRRILLVGICLCLIAVVGFSLLTAKFSQDYRDAAAQKLEENIRRTAVACYGAEGFYPPDTTYLSEHYGIAYDSEQFIIHYELFASNIMPDITVLKK